MRLRTQRRRKKSFNRRPMTTMCLRTTMTRSWMQSTPSLVLEKIVQQETDDNDVLENNYDEILDAVNTIFGSGITEDVNGGEAKEIVTSTEAELLTTEEP